MSYSTVPNVITKIEINGLCEESYPCYHEIAINGVNQGTWDGVMIARWFKDHDRPIPDHFADYERMIKE